MLEEVEKEKLKKEDLEEILSEIRYYYESEFEKRLERFKEYGEKLDKIKVFGELRPDLGEINRLSIDTAEILSFLVRFYEAMVHKESFPSDFNKKVREAVKLLRRTVELIVDPKIPRGFSYPPRGRRAPLAGEEFPESLVPLGNCSVLEGILEADLFLREKVTEDNAVKKLVELLLNDKLRKEGFYDNAYFFHKELDKYEGPTFHDLWTTSTVATLLKVVYSIVKDSDKELSKRIGKVLEEIIEGTCNILNSIIRGEREYIQLEHSKLTHSQGEGYLHITNGRLEALRDEANDLISGKKSYTYLFAIARILLLGLNEEGKPEDFVEDSKKDTYINTTKAWLRITLNGIKHVKENIEGDFIKFKDEEIPCLTYDDERRELVLSDRSVNPLPLMAKVLIELYRRLGSEVIEVAMDPFLSMFYPWMGISIRELVKIYKERKEKGYKIFGLFERGYDDFGATNLISFLLVEYHKSFSPIENSFFGKPSKFLKKMERRPKRAEIRIEPAIEKVLARLLIIDEDSSVVEIEYSYPIDHMLGVLEEIGNEVIEGRMRKGAYDEKGQYQYKDREVKEKIFHENIEKIGDRNLLEPIIDYLPSGTPIILAIPETHLKLPWEVLINRPVGRIPITSYHIKSKEIREDYVIRILLIGNPTGDLENAEEEVATIRDTLEKLNSEGYFIHTEMKTKVRRKDLEKLLKEESWDIIHFAGHAKKEERGEIAWILKDNEPFYLSSIKEYYAPTFIFANACDTAMTNEDILSLPVKLLEEGVIAFIGTLWPVHDDSAIKFAETFYKNLLSGRGMSIGEAFHVAREELYRNNDPNWMNYVLYGDPRFRLIRGK
jgi:hypothetical protein